MAVAALGGHGCGKEWLDLVHRRVPYLLSFWIIIIIQSAELDSRSPDLDTGFFRGAMGHSRAEKAGTHKRIVAIASKRFREQSLAEVARNLLI